MTAVVAKLSVGRVPPRTAAATPDDHEAALVRSVRLALDDYLVGRKLVAVKIRQLEGKNIYGFLKIEGRGERRLVDFKATATPQGGLLSLQVGGKWISPVTDSATKRPR